MTSGDSHPPRILSRADHPISRQNIDADALKVLYRLHRSGQLAYMVGGAVRDLMLGRTPKDYDVCTDARPTRVRRLFRNSRIIGRRFRLVHVFFRGNVVEVATFRRDPDPEAQASASDELLITDDNVWGNAEQDAFRRDFTVNALFYNIADYTVIDYVGGIDDLRSRTIRTIGDPEVRFREDPVRMTRACELAGRLGFTIEGQTQSAIVEHHAEILKASTARITEELLQILRCGRAGAAMQWMLELELLSSLVPEAHAMSQSHRLGLGDYGVVLPIIDRRVANQQTPSEIGLLSALMLPHALVVRHEAERGRRRPLRGEALMRLYEEAIAPFFGRFTLARTKAELVVKTLLTLDGLVGRSVPAGERVRLASRPYFDDLLLLLEIVAAATDQGRDDLKEWRKAAEGRPQKQARRRKRRPRRRRRRGGKTRA